MFGTESLKFPSWIQKSFYGGLICAFCMSEVVQIGGIWLCTSSHCVKHDDIPTEQQKGFSGWEVSNLISGTVASGVSGSIQQTISLENFDMYKK